jgi:hypothetical protein
MAGKISAKRAFATGPARPTGESGGEIEMLHMLTAKAIAAKT